MNKLNKLVKGRHKSSKKMPFKATFSTGFFCEPDCIEQGLGKKNVERFATLKEVLSKGYRPCAYCNPLEKGHRTPHFVKKILKKLHENPLTQISGIDLHEKKIEPYAMTHWFVKKHGMTFRAYQRVLRVNSSFKETRDKEWKKNSKSEKVLLNDSTHSFASIFDLSLTPSKKRRRGTICVKRIETPMGTMFACAVDEGICLLEFVDHKMLETQFKTISKKLKASIVHQDHVLFAQLEKELIGYFRGVRKYFKVPLLVFGTTFQKSTWRKLTKIPYGETKNYKEYAAMLGQLTLIGTVANAIRTTRIAIIIPCHRVVGSTKGELIGYGGGLWRKKLLLDLEAKYKKRKDTKTKLVTSTTS